MFPYNPQDTFSEMSLYDLIDLVKGGSLGASNIPLKVLADRTQYLFNRQGVVVPKMITGNYTYDAADVNTVFAFNITSNAVFNLPDVTSVPLGSVIRISARINAIKALTANCVAGQKIFDGADDVTAMYLHNADRLWLYSASSTNGVVGDHWEVLLPDGNFFNAGESFGGRKEMRNTIRLEGKLFNRVDMPRLTAFALSLPAGEAIVDDATWLSDPGGKPYYRGLYSYGNGTSTLRMADERGMSDRYLDLGRGIDNGRFPVGAGGYEPDAVGDHNHPTKLPHQDDNTGDDGAEENRYQPGWLIRPDRLDMNAFTGSNQNAAPENRIKTIGKISLTRY